MRTKLTVELPTLAEITRGLDPHDVHPALAKAERALADAERDLATARSTLDQRNRDVATLPAKVQAGEAVPADLEAAMRAQRAAALVVPEHERTVAEMRQSLRGELERATERRRAEMGTRLLVLRRAAEQMAPVLEELRTLELGLARAVDPENEMGLGVEWPASLKDELNSARYRLAFLNRTPSPSVRMTSEDGRANQDGARDAKERQARDHLATLHTATSRTESSGRAPGRRWWW